jgi:hypothetical protein
MQETPMIKIALLNGSMEIEPLWSNGYLAVHEACSSSWFYTLTHVPTGALIMGGAGNPHDLVSLAMDLPEPLLNREEIGPALAARIKQAIIELAPRRLIEECRPTWAAELRCSEREVR